MKRRALITGVTGQDGSYLAEFLLDKDYEVVGIVRRHSTLERANIDHLHNVAEGTSAINLVYGDLSDASSLNRVLRDFKPHEVYNLGAQSHVRVSFEIPEYTADVDALGTIRLLEAIRDTGLSPRFYQASTSELYGKVVETPQTETTPFYPRSPYACAKAYAFHITRNYREAYDMFAVNGILFNHESPRRGPNFVTRKVTLGAARIKLGLQNKLHLGNLEARRDWGHARDFVRAMWLMLQAEKPDDYVIATGKSHSIKDLLEIACSHVGLDWKDYVETDQRHFRPSEVDTLLGDPSKAKRELGWEPEVTFADMIREMVDADLEAESKRPR